MCQPQLLFYVPVQPMDNWYSRYLQLDVEEVVEQYGAAQRRLLVLGYNATLTTAVEAPRQPKRHFDQIRVRAASYALTVYCLENMGSALTALSSSFLSLNLL